ncbi:succinyldiaminopimelate transaminase [Psychrobacter ciconiae]|uniref:succinyldiaminopimelate transaminase n=1 Tax=Psychrobacter ciconiae TaxID=1553449 RepID=UPI001918C265|nr:succinyldiaminopimelate transaminase [Psychrobacter ciconiae]
MNNNLTALQPYPFAKMATLLANSNRPQALSEIKLGIGEPKHEPPQFVLDELHENLDRLSEYPTINGLFDLRQTIAHWLERRFFLHHVSPESQVLPVLGSREAIFSFVQAAVDHSDDQSPIVMMPNPFYQIYEGAAILANAEPYFVPCLPANQFKGDYRSVAADIWERTQVVFVCSPNNPTGAVMAMDDWEYLIRLSDKHHFIIASDECYSEIYLDEPPIGLLQACAALGRDDFTNCIVFHSLSKRSNLPGLRSGFVAGDANLLAPYLNYRTYHGCAMPVPTQLATIKAWQDERHVAQNRALYREKFALWQSELGEWLDLRLPAAGFYLWIKVPAKFNHDDEVFVKALFEEVGIFALAGSYLSRDVAGQNAGKGYIRVALVASLEENAEAIRRIKILLSK